MADWGLGRHNQFQGLYLTKLGGNEKKAKLSYSLKVFLCPVIGQVTAQEVTVRKWSREVIGGEEMTL